VTTKIDAAGLLPNEEAGLVMMGIYSYLANENRKGFRLEHYFVRMLKEMKRRKSRGDLTDGQLYLRVVGPVWSVVSVIAGQSRFSEIGKPFKAREGRWIGAKVGLFAVSFAQAETRGYADFDWFRFGPYVR
jgi:hypothetical protein